jgi:hypothetical protein
MGWLRFYIRTSSKPLIPEWGELLRAESDQGAQALMILADPFMNTHAQNLPTLA